MKVCEKCGRNVFDGEGECQFCRLPATAKTAAVAPALAPPGPFDPRTEVSADARHIVKHLWIILVLLPGVVGLCWLLVTVAENH